MNNVNLDCVINALYPAAVNGVHYELTDYGDGPEITRWDPALGYRPTAGQIAQAEPSAVIADVRARQISTLRSNCQATIEKGFTSDATGKARFYPMDVYSQGNLESANTRALSINAFNLIQLTSFSALLTCATDAERPNAVWPLVSHTAKQARDVHAAWLAWRASQQQQFRLLVDQIQRADTAAAAQAVLWSAATN